MMEARRRAVGGAYAYDGHLHALGLYALETDRWARLFEHSTTAAALRAAVSAKNAFTFKAQTRRVRAGVSARSLADPQRTR